MHRLLFALALFLLSAPAGAQPVVRGLDHVPIVVRDLDRAKADLEALGFSLKPGRAHRNGLRNAHAKFADGTEIELISPTAAVDDLSSTYIDWLKEGDGPISFGLYAPGVPPDFRPTGWKGVFFDHRQKSPTDRPEHFAHANGAVSLWAVWLAGSPAAPTMIRSSIGRLVERQTCGPFGVASRHLELEEGEIVLMRESLRRQPDRPIVALTVAVTDLGKAGRFASRTAEGCGRRSVWAETHGLWLEFLER